ncbi:MAG: hypothetical protein ACLROY_10605 [Mediterraneibacter sp.]|jgi:hypothetical protein
MDNIQFTKVLTLIDEELPNIFHIECIYFGDFRRNTYSRYLPIGERLKIYLGKDSYALNEISQKVLENIANEQMCGRHLWSDYPDTEFVVGVIDKISKKLNKKLSLITWRPENAWEANFGVAVLLADSQKYEDWLGEHGGKAFFELVIKYLFCNITELDADKYFDHNRWIAHFENICENLLEKYLEDTISITARNLSYLSSLTLEGEYTISEMYIMNNDDFSLKELEVQLDSPIAILQDNMRVIRKLLQIADKELPLVVCENTILGFGLRNSYECIKYKILFNGFMHWELWRDNKVIIIHKNGRCIFHNYKREEECYKVLINKYFPENYDTSPIVDVISTAVKQRHGTSILIMEDAYSETKRLCDANRGIRIKRKCMSNYLQILEKMTSIDGAILLDLQCNCWGIGIILDGNAIVYGNNSRGARYNSVHNYVANKKTDGKICIGIIISEDGMVNIVSASEMTDENIIMNKN